MPVQLTYPGVYIEEVSSGVRTITGVATSVAAFVGYTARGRDNRAIRIQTFADFEREFGGLASDSELSYAVSHFYANGGGEAWIVRIPRKGAVAAAITLEDKVGAGAKEALKLTALSSGIGANGLLVDIDYDGAPDADSYNLTISDPLTGVIETFSVSQKSTATNNVVAIVNDEGRGSKLVTVAIPDGTAGRPSQTGTSGSDVVLTGAGVPDLTAPFKFKISTDLPTSGTQITDVEVTLLAAGETAPTSVLGLARLLERKINETIGATLKGAAVRLEPNENGKGLRAYADFDQDLVPSTLDAIVTFKDSGNLKLNAADADANVAHFVLGTGRAIAGQLTPVAGTQGTGLPDAAGIIGSRAAIPPTGLFALEKVDLFNILLIPDATRAKAGSPGTPDITDPLPILSAALTYAKERRAFLLVDPPPNVDDVDAATDWKSKDLATLNEPNGAAYFPRLRMADPLDDFQLRSFAPSGVIAGLYARIDANRGVWKAPAGTEATLTDVRSPAYLLTDAENGVLNPLGLNCLRSFPVYGNISWGARTLVGADALGSEWKYVPVRRLALFLEESLFRGSKWAVFEPNDEPLWAQLRLNIGAFMNSLFRQGAFAGKTPKEAYLVKCDRETTTQDDVNRGVVNILVAFAPLKPAEFVVLRIQQMAGQLQT